MSWLKNWFGRMSPNDSAIGPQQPGQKLMTLDERMAFRREMVFEAMREVLVNHGLPPLSYKLNVARLDSRGHRYAVMVDLVSHLAGRVVDAPGEWQVMETQATHAASSRYRVKISSVYWRLEAQGFAPGQQMAMEAIDTSQVFQTSSTLHTADHVTNKTASGSVDDFPDTQLDDRRSREESISQDELLAFEQAVQQSKNIRLPVHLGSRTYQTDFMPLV